MSYPTENPRGSEWRIWDLHVHTPASYGGKFEDFISNAAKSEAEVIGINDYATLDGYEEICKLGGVAGKVIFPVVELRMHNVLITKHNPNGVHINFHIIFDNDPNIFQTIKTFLNSLDCWDKTGTKHQLGGVQDRKDVSCNSLEVIEKLHELKLFGTHALIWIPYDEYGGIDEIDPINDPQFKASLIKEAHIMGSSTAKQIAFFKWDDDRYTEAQYKDWLGRRKPCIKGSDAHKIDYPLGRLQNSKSEPVERYCWIKANPTFSGLKQIVFEPDRVFVGKEPDLTRRVRENKTKFIREVKIGAEPDQSSAGIWFDDVTLELNSSLVAIIGNKGSGKSALTDIVALCGNTHQSPDNFSFLTGEKFRKRFPENLSTKFRGPITWEDDSSQSRLLSENPDRLQPERVRYIPQHFFEKVCSSVESGEFEEELKHIVYSHTPQEKRLDMASLDDLIDHKSRLVDAQIDSIKGEISDLNREIVGLEEMRTVEFITELKGRIKLLTDALATHETIKPVAPVTTALPDAKSQALESEMKDKRAKIKTLEDEITKDTNERVGLYIKSDELDQARRFYADLDESLKAKQGATDHYVKILKANDIKISDVFSFAIDVEPIKAAKLKIDARIAELDPILNEADDKSKPHALSVLRAELARAMEELDKPARMQQQYQTDLENWNRKRVEILGDERSEESLPFLQKRLEYVETNLPTQLEASYTLRQTKLKSLFGKKFELRSIRQELFDPVSDFVKKFPELDSNYDVHLNVSLNIQNFSEQFFAFVSQGKIGSFQGAEDGYKRLMELIEEATVENEQGGVEFVEKVLDNLKRDHRDSPPKIAEVNNQLKKGFELNQLYDFLFHLDYVVPSYNLKLGEKDLSELSPGERGTLLLIFYLLLDSDDIPLILDQPEDNLDNESIFLVLVKFIKRVKNERQIIIVTHNPNLAIVCDAEQIVHCQIEKDNKNNVVFYSGSIEDSSINLTSINILEGTLPAFDNRDSKYIRPDLSKSTDSTKADVAAP